MDGGIEIDFPKEDKILIDSPKVNTYESRRPSGLRKTTMGTNSLAHRTTWLRSDLYSFAFYSTLINDNI